MASIKKHENGRWRARYFDDDGKQHERHFGFDFLWRHSLSPC